MKKVTNLMERIIRLMNNDKFKSKSKRNSKDFTRERKAGFVSLHINKKILTGKLRTRLIEMVLTDDLHHMEQIYETFLAEIQRHVVPFIPGHRYKRKKKTSQSIQQHQKAAFIA